MLHDIHAPKIGMRMIKSGLAVVASFLVWQIVRIFNTNLELHPVFAYITAVLAMRDTDASTLDYGNIRVKSTILGLSVAMILIWIYGQLIGYIKIPILQAGFDITLIFIGVLLSISLAVVIKCKNLSAISAVVFLICMVRFNNSENRYVYALLRTVETIIGVAVTIPINRYIFPYKSSDTKFIAHRGLSGIEQENTIAAFVAAGNRGYFGIETDIHKTLDGEYVAIHDDNTKRVAVDNFEIEKTNFDTLRNLILLDKSGEKSRSDLRIPTLREYISVCKKYDKKAVLELKNKFTFEEICEIISIINEFDFLENVIFISFVLENLIDVRKINPNQNAQYLVSKYSDNLIQILKSHKLDLDINYKELTKERIEMLHEENIKINCFTCDNKDDANKLIKLGVEYITTNILE